MSNHQTRISRLEACEPRPEHSHRAIEAGLALQTEDYLAEVLDAGGKPRSDLSEEDRAAVEEVIGLLKLGEERARQARERGDDGQGPTTDEGRRA